MFFVDSVPTQQWKKSRCMLKSHFSSTLSLPHTQFWEGSWGCLLWALGFSSGRQHFPPLLFWISLKMSPLVAFRWQAIAVKTPPSVPIEGLVMLLPKTSSCAWCTVRPNNTKTSESGAEKGPCKENRWLILQKPQTPQRVSAKHFFFS